VVYFAIGGCWLISKKESDKGLPVPVCLMFRRFLIFVPFIQYLLLLIPAAQNGVYFWLPLCTYIPICLLLSLLCRCWLFNLLTTCSIVAVSRCIFVIHGTNIGDGAGCFLSCLVLPSVSACRRVSNFLVIVFWGAWWSLAAYSFSLFALLLFWGVYSFLTSSTGCLLG
jgi:hypothetical protein